MALLLRKILNFHDFALEQWRDTRADEWLFMSSLWPCLTILSCYLYFVLSLGPKLMENRKAFNIDKILILYNGIQVIYCFILIATSTIYLVPHYNMFCEPCDFSMSFRGMLAAELYWWYFLLKLVDLLDTVFFVLRKNYHQISFLHVYHHAGMVIGTWIACRFLPGGSLGYIGYLNCIVHVAMYSYYLLSVINKSYRNNLCFKKQITHLQLMQFGLITVLFTVMLIRDDCPIPTWILLLVIPQNFLMFCMFGDFYVRTYIKKIQKA